MRKLAVAVVVVTGMLSGAPLYAQVDLSGVWNQRQHEDRPERGPGPEFGDYTGLPLNEAGRMRGDTWDASKWSVVEHMCDPHPADYASHGPGNMRIQPTADPNSQEIIAWQTTLSWMLPERTIWMDGRAHPPAHAPHTWQGFSTGHWEGDMLVVTATHLKEGWTRRNGIPSSDERTLTEYFIRQSEYLTLVSIIDDPAYLEEPMIRTNAWCVASAQCGPRRVVK